MRAPLISVLMGSLYRRDDLSFLRRSVESILAQSMGDFEFLVCDDGSTEEARRAYGLYAEQDERVRLIRRGDRITLPQKLNCCAAAASGAYFARMDDDDASHPERFARQLAALERNHDISFVGCAVRLVRGGKVVGVKRLPEYPAVRDFYMTQPYIHPTLMFRRQALDAAGGYSEKPAQILCEDYDLLLRLYAKGFKGMNLQDALLDYTVAETAKGNRKMRHRWNETVTRWNRFRELGVLPGALPYVVKPLAVGLLPERVLESVKGVGR